nr:EAL domain-containing protein [Dysosmobacter acutus]
MRAAQGLCCIYLYCTPHAQMEESFFVDPREAEIPGPIRQLLKQLAKDGASVPPEDGRLFARQLRLQEGGAFGAVCFARGDGPWPEAEHPLLESIAAVYAYALRAEWDRRDASLQNWVWSKMMDSTNACIYVTDPQTDEILFMNQAMKQAFSLEDPEGKLCWQVLQYGQQGRCAFCPVQMLTEDGSAPSCVWEEQNPVTGRTYENYDSLMRWTDGRLVHFHHSTDVTETRRLYQAAMIDELTGALSRRAGKQSLSLLLEKIGGGEPLCVCMLDVNGLKAVNDLHGHAAGDSLLKRVASTVRRMLHGEEFFMRLSGDEFVAVLPGVRQNEATARIQAMLEELSRDRPAFFPEGDAFCYGVIEVRDRIAMQDALARADERMYQQKRRVHIRRAEALLDQPQSRGPSAPFSYDANLLYDALVASTDDYVYVCDMKTGVFRYTSAMVAEFGLPGEVIPNAAAVWGAKVHPHDKRVFLESNQEIIDGRTDVHCVEYRAQNVRGEWLWLRCRGHLQRDESGDPALFAGFITNLGKKNKLDPLTGLFNKFELENDVTQLLDGSTPKPLTFMLLGIDDFKHINSLYDRVFGDEVIRIVAHRLRSLLPPNSTVYRLDGDEFAILMRGSSRTAADQLFRLIRESFSEQQVFDEKKFYCTLSGGCVFAPDNGSSYVELARCASYALEYAKRRGKNRLERYTHEIVAGRRRTLELTELLRESVEHGFENFELYYQPVFNMSRQVIGAEALARWSCAKYGPVSPAEFIPLLEQSGLILPVGRWIFREVLSTCVSWERDMSDLAISINLSYLQLQDESFFPFMLDTVKESGADPRHIVLELTESYLAANMDRVAQLLTDTRRSGIRVAMDDFGTGYSSLGVLKTAPIDIAKIDRTFVKGIQSSTFDSAFLRLVVELCGVLGIDTCLEGVETEDEFDAVRSMSLSYIQGFLLGRPLPAEEFRRSFLLQS